ncbi:hypothetical protein BDQ17DRAFT_1546478 [Cyathus striatus]|nr:hypothetical protein BDQ17DRAFT_1546478 [Cyathus striatus]
MSSNHDTRTTVLPENREYVSFVCTGYLLENLTLLARGPLEVSWMISEPLRELVNSKVKKQDNIMRTELQDFGYHIEPNDISQLAKKESPFESVLMQLLTALLEHCVQVFYVASKNILDYKEFETINNNFYQLLNAADDRLEYLKGKLDGISAKSTDSVDDFYGGMFRLFSKYNDNMEIYDTLKCNEEEIDCFMESISIVDQYELPSSPDDISNVLIYSTWESHKKSIPENTIPKKIPVTWNDPEGMYHDGPDRKALSADYHSCADKNGDFNDLPKIMPHDQNHYWWHTMLYLPGQVASEIPNDSSVSLNKDEVVESDPLFHDLSTTDVNRINEEILEMKERLGRMESVLERLCKVIEEKL